MGVRVPGAAVLGWIANTFAMARGAPEVADALGRALPRVRVGDIPDYAGSSSYEYSDLSIEYNEPYDPSYDSDFYDQSFSRSDEQVVDWLDQIEHGSLGQGPSTPPSEPGSGPPSDGGSGSPGKRGEPSSPHHGQTEDVGNGIEPVLEDQSQNNDEGWGPERYRNRWSDELGRDTTDSLDRYHEVMANHGYDWKQAITILQEFEGDMAKTEADTAVGSGGVSFEASTVVDHAVDSAGIRDPTEDIKKALLDVLKASYNFWPQFANAIYDILKKMEEKPHSKTLEDILANGPPPKMTPYRGISYPYRRGRVPGPGKEPVPVKLGEGYHTKPTVPWFCERRTSEAIRASAEADTNAVMDGLENLNGDQQLKDTYLAKLRNDKSEAARLVEAVPNAICKLHMDPESLPDYQTPKTMGYEATYHALLRMWKSVLKSKTAPIDVPEVNYCANLTSNQYSEAHAMSKQSLSDALHRYAHANKTALEGLARNDHDTFHFMRTWSVPIVTCKVQMELKSPTLSEQERNEYQDGFQIMRELLRTLYDINTTPGLDGVKPAPTATETDSFKVPGLEWPYRFRFCPMLDTTRFTWTDPKAPQGLMDFEKAVKQHMELFKEHRDQYLQYMKTHRDEIVSTVDGLDEAECMANQHIQHWHLTPDMLPTLRDMLKALREIINTAGPGGYLPDVPKTTPTATKTDSFHVPEFQIARPSICPDFRQHMSNYADPPWALDLAHDPFYVMSLIAIGKMTSQAMDLFENNRDEYLQYMESHPDQFATTIKVIQDVGCAMRSAPATWPTYNKGLTVLLWNIFSPRKRYQKTFPALLRALEDTVPVETDLFKAPNFELPSRPPICPDFVHHNPGMLDAPWALDLIRDKNYVKSLRPFKTIATQALALFEYHRDEYLQYLQSHPEELATTIQVVKDVECAVLGADTALPAYHRALNDVLFLVAPSERYKKTLSAFLRALKLIKKD